MESANKKYILGLDLGETSLGVAVLDAEEQEGKLVPMGIRNLGVRIFPDGRDDESKEPLNVSRRGARGMRRNRKRDKQRQDKLFNFLKRSLGISTIDYKTDPYQLRAKALDKELTKEELARCLLHINQRRGFLSNRKELKKINESSNMKIALRETKESITKDNCKTLGEWLAKQEKCKRVVVEQKNSKSTYTYFPSRELYRDEIKEILKKQKEFYPELNKQIKYREYDFIKSKYEECSKTFEEIVDYIIFSQRPLKPQGVGQCIFECNVLSLDGKLLKRGEYRICKAMPSFQNFRIWQEVNNLKINDKELTLEQKEKIVALLKKQKSVSFSTMRKGIEFDKTATFNFESEKRMGLDGDITAGEMRKFIENWDELDLKTQGEYVNIILNAETNEEILDFFRNKNVKLEQVFKEVKENDEQIDEETGEVLKKKTKKQVEVFIYDVDLKENDYGSLSLVAINKLLPFLKEGYIYSDAVEKYAEKQKQEGNVDEYEKYKQHSNQEAEKSNELPYYGKVLAGQTIGGSYDLKDGEEKCYGKITNVTVHKGLNQIRKCINEIVEKYGKPSEIHLEIARTLKMSKKQKKELNSKQTEEQKKNEIIKAELQEADITINYDNIEKYKIWENMNREPGLRCCPYCGKSIISIEALFNDTFEIEHILPISRTYDDSKKNKIISCSSCNRNKKEKTPFEAWGQETRYEAILNRAKYLGSYYFKDKKDKKDSEEKLASPFLWRFKENAMEKWKEENKVLDRMLVDTQYLSKATGQYLTALLPRENILVNPGRMTAMLRHHWGLNTLISEDDKKDRTDHRHHAIDAFVVGCINRSNIKRIATISGNRYIKDNEKAVQQAKVKEIPFENFTHDVIKEKVNNIIISFKPKHPKVEKEKSTDALHEETFYGKKILKEYYKVKNKEGHTIFQPKTDKNGDEMKKEVYTITKPLSKDFKDFDKIADKKIKEELQNLGSDEIGKQMQENGFVKLKWKNKKDRECKMELKSVRLHEARLKSLVKIADYEKYADTGGNFCAYICETRDKKGNDTWKIDIPSNFVRHKSDYKPPENVVMQLFINDMVEIDYEKTKQNSTANAEKFKNYALNGKIICRVKKMSGEKITLIPHRLAKEEKKGAKTWTISASQFKDVEGKKIKVDILGNITYLTK